MKKFKLINGKRHKAIYDGFGNFIGWIQCGIND